MVAPSMHVKVNETSNVSYTVMSANADIGYGTCTSDSIGLTPKLYKSRYFMLLLFSLCTLLNGFQWIQYSIITSIVTCYYGVSVAWINMTSLLYAVMFLPLVIPVAWMMSTKGLKMTLILAAAGNSIGACIQCFSLAPNQFYVVMITQTITSISQVFSLCPPAYIAAVWFGSNEVSVACAFGIISNQIGTAIGFIVPPLLVPGNCDDVLSVKSGLRDLALGQAVLNTAVFLAIVIFFKDRPPVPPSIAEFNKPSNQQSTSRSLWEMFKNLNFFLLWITYGLNAAVYNSILTMLNQMVVRTFPGEEVEAGWIGVEIIFTGIVGSLISGYILDRTHKFRESFFVLNFLSFVVMAIYTGVYRIKIMWMYFLMLGTMGFVMAAYIPVGYEFAAEITYPIPEGSSTTLILASASLFGIPVTMLASWLEQTYGDLASNLLFCSCLVIACILSAFIKCEKKRCMQDHLTQRLHSHPA